MTEIIPLKLSVHGKDCLGCKRTGTQIMVTLKSMNYIETYTDIFLTTEQAQELRDSLNYSLRNNK